MYNFWDLGWAGARRDDDPNNAPRRHIGIVYNPDWDEAHTTRHKLELALEHVFVQHLVAAPAFHLWFFDNRLVRNPQYQGPPPGKEEVPPTHVFYGAGSRYVQVGADQIGFRSGSDIKEKMWDAGYEVAAGAPQRWRGPGGLTKRLSYLMRKTNRHRRRQGVGSISCGVLASQFV
ncbi:hypothetical protein B0T24DRAFT_680265 [Lasiosphaeria ovina]|uniref:Uncharacterized protein n=1 Tax=Lasiosphaeria ovina TaxID=92902 RepID=A0AAE0N5M2_9PEZI|nr:hypothetical protein B0T24DRAFT_680265 [Lasiosphaeria ovina]